MKTAQNNYAVSSKSVKPGKYNSCIQNIKSEGNSTLRSQCKNKPRKELYRTVNASYLVSYIKRNQKQNKKITRSTKSSLPNSPSSSTQYQSNPKNCKISYRALQYRRSKLKRSFLLFRNRQQKHTELGSSMFYAISQHFHKFKMLTAVSAWLFTT